MNRIELKARAGVTLVETLIAMTIMAIFLSGLGGMAFTAARNTTRATADTYRQGVLQQEANKVLTWPYAQLGGLAGCQNTATGRFPHRRCITVTTMGNNYSRVTIIVQPGQPGIASDTLVLERTRPPVANVLSSS